MKLANFECFSITRGKMHHRFEPKVLVGAETIFQDVSSSKKYGVIRRFHMLNLKNFAKKMGIR
jgi:hypothetical protein